MPFRWILFSLCALISLGLYHAVAEIDTRVFWLPEGIFCANLLLHLFYRPRLAPPVLVARATRPHATRSVSAKSAARRSAPVLPRPVSAEIA